jgi:hypothetical protein
MFLRAAGAAAGALALAWLVTAATDEGAVEWGERVGRAIPLTPLCAALGVSAALAPARWRGEARALAALGRSRVQVAAGAVLGAAVVASAAALVVGLVGAVDVAGFYPSAPHAPPWRWDGARFLDAAGWRSVTADGAPHRLEAISHAAWLGSLPAHARLAAGATTALAGLALALLAAQALLGRSLEPARPRRSLALVASLGAITASVALFQAAAAGLVTPLAAVLPAALLLAFAARRARLDP